MATVTLVPIKGFTQHRTFVLQNVASSPENEAILLARSPDSKTVEATDSGRFKSRVVSRKHGIIYMQYDKIYIKDMRSSAGTFLNNDRLSQSGKLSAPYELKNGDFVQLGEDIEVDGERIECVIFKAVVEYMERHEETLLDQSIETQIKQKAREEFQQMWKELIGPLKSPPLKKLHEILATEN